MFGWFKRKAEVPTPKPQSRGFFSTHDDFIFDARLSEAEQVETLMAKTFQRSVKDLKITTKNGDVETTMAMDEAYPGLQQVKIQNSLGSCLPAQQVQWFLAQGFIGYQTAAMLSQNWLINKACTVPAQDAVRNGYEITVNDGEEVDPEILQYIRKCDKKYHVKQQCVEFLRMGRIFGIRIMLFKVRSSDPLYYEKPFNIDGVKPGAYEGMTQIDPYWITPELDFDSAANPASMHFYEPTWWYLSGRRIHRSHLVIFRNYGQPPDILKPTYFYGGYPLPQLIAERVYAAERTANEAPLLAMSKRMTVLNVDLSQAMANQQEFVQKMAFWSLLQNNFGIKVIGEAETIEQFDTTLADMDALIMTQYQLVAAIAGCPATKILGTSPKGFGASGDYEKSSYRETLESLEMEIDPVLDRHHELLNKSEIKPKFGQDFEIEHLWNSSDTPTAKEQAEINLIEAQTDNALVQAGGIDGTDVRQRIIAKPESGYNGFEEVVEGGPGDREAQQEQEAALEAPIQASNKQKQGGQDGAYQHTESARGSKATGFDMPEGEFDPQKGTWNGARLVTHQKFLDGAIVDEKIKNNDFLVNVTPPFEDDGKMYRMILDGHHSLAAAVKAKVMPTFVERMPREEIINAATREVTDNK